MTNDNDKVIITENGWEIYEEDDDLINKELLKISPIYKKLYRTESLNSKEVLTETE